jgi:hypothetical protein
MLFQNDLNFAIFLVGTASILFFLERYLTELKKIQNYYFYEDHKLKKIVEDSLIVVRFSLAFCGLFVLLNTFESFHSFVPFIIWVVSGLFIGLLSYLYKQLKPYKDELKSENVSSEIYKKLTDLMIVSLTVYSLLFIMSILLWKFKKQPDPSSNSKDPNNDDKKKGKN